MVVNKRRLRDKEETTTYARVLRNKTSGGPKKPEGDNTHASTREDATKGNATGKKIGLRKLLSHE